MVLIFLVGKYFYTTTMVVKLLAAFPGRFIASLWKTARIEQLLREEHLLMEVVFPTKEGSAGSCCE